MSQVTFTMESNTTEANIRYTEIGNTRQLLA